VTGPIARAAVVGTGVIGAGWAALFLAAGLDVVATDPASDAERRLREDVAAHWPALERRGLAPGADRGRLQFVRDISDAVSAADFVQENGPERIDIKRPLIAELDDATSSGVVIASSSSGLGPTDMQRDCERQPERVLVGHPFNPAHLIPLVEVVPGHATSEQATQCAIDFYRSLGKHPIRVRMELPGHVANRLQAALWREAYDLVERGAATVADIDIAISSGPGLRWALLGPFVNQHLSGGPGGLEHVLEHLGPPMVDWWKSFETPDLTPDLSRRLIEGVATELRDIDQDAMVRERDALLEQLLTAKASCRHIPTSEGER
jgi:carnitine 3-dehydrogenase